MKIAGRQDLRLVLIDPDPASRATLAERLRAHDFIVDEAPDVVTGAEVALAAPPSAVICDLWLPGVSGVQLCRLLKAEPATADVPVVLRAEHEDPRSRFWATRAGAALLVSKERIGELLRGLARIAKPRPENDFFFQLSGGAQDVRERIAQHLDRALFESVVTAEVRTFAGARSFQRLFDSLSQLISQLVRYRWLALSTSVTPPRFAIHGHQRTAHASVDEARRALAVPDSVPGISLLDADAAETIECERTLVAEIVLGQTPVGRLGISVSEDTREVDELLPMIANELGGPLSLAMLLEESRHLAAMDPLTGLLNRRSFGERVEIELARCSRSLRPASLLVLDLDHFKAINDNHGHSAGDQVLAAVGAALISEARATDLVARWGGEEFVIALPGVGLSGAHTMAERVRRAIEALVVTAATGERIPLSASIGVAEARADERIESLVNRADRAMYQAKLGGRNRVCDAESERPSLRVA